MTKQEKIKEFIELCEGLAISNDSPHEQTIIDFINSLQSENNNGWIKIESEDDLPKEDGFFEAWLDNEYIGRIFFNKDFNEWHCAYDSDNLRFPTHYQPIEKPKPPIY